MKSVLIHGFCAKNHSWAIVHQNLAKQLIKLGYDVDMFSTNGNENFPQDLLPNLKGFHNSKGALSEIDLKELADKSNSLKKEYDIQISYTAMRNFSKYLNRGSKNRFGIWAFEFEGKNSLPAGWAKFYKNCDLMLPPSTYAKKVFEQSGVPEKVMHIIPHGIDDCFLNGQNVYPLKTNKKFKFLISLGQVHLRKGLKETIEAYFKAFTNKDDVSFVFKIQDVPRTMPFQLDFYKTLNELKKQFPSHPEVIILKDFIPDLAPLFRACNAYVCASKAECFAIPALESLASGKILIVSRHGGQLDFCNDQNSLMVEGVLSKAPPAAVYWEPNNRSYWFEPNIESISSQMIRAFKEENELLIQYQPEFIKIKEKYTWENAVKAMEKLFV